MANGTNGEPATVGTGPNSANIVVTPPAAGGPFASFNLTICIAGTTDCFTQSCPASGGTNTTCPISAPGCADTATDCLRAETNYTVTAVAINFDGDVSLPSNTEPFQTTKYPCVFGGGGGARLQHWLVGH